MSDQHSSAPWTVYNDHPSEKNIFYIRVAPARYAYNSEIAVVFGGANSAAVANARLIAAAPDLLETLQKAADTLRDVAMALDIFGKSTAAEACRIAEKASRDVIAKAEGTDHVDTHA